MSLRLNSEGGFDFLPPSECQILGAIAAVASIAATAKSIFSDGGGGGGGGDGGALAAQIQGDISNLAKGQKELADAFKDTTQEFTSRIGRVERGIVSPVGKTNEFNPVDTGANTAGFIFGALIVFILLSKAMKR